MKWIIVDFGTKRIKLLHVTYEGQRVSIENFHSFESKPEFFKGLGLPEPAAWAATTIALNELDWLKPDEEVMLLPALPSAYLEARYLKFPFKSEKQIEKVLQFELESMLPFDIEEVQVRNQILEGDGVQPLKKETLLMALSYRRQLIRQTELELKKFQLSIPPMTAHSLALSSLRPFITEHPVFGIFEFGYSQSHLLILQKNGGILSSKTFWWGAKNLIEALQEEMAISPEEAEKLFAHMDPEKEPTKAMGGALKQLTTEVRQALKGLTNSGLQLPKPLPLYVFGRLSHYVSGMSQIENGLDSEFSAKLIPFPFSVLKTKQIQGLSKLPDIESALPALAIALTQTRSHRSKIPIFSETSFQFQQNLKKLKSGSFSLLRRVAGLLIAPFIYAVIQISIQTKENKQLLSFLPKILEGSSIQMAEDSTPESIATQIRKELASNRQKISQLEENKESPLKALVEVSQAIPNYLKIDVREMKITSTSISFSAETNSQESAARIVESLSKVYPSVKTGATTACAGQNRPDCRFFKVEIERTQGS